jgi:acetylornithine deacetylase/succinyl-diaminopimelate desuccinylase-like protein
MLLRVLRPFRGVDPARRRKIRIGAAAATAALILLLVVAAWIARRVAILKLDRSWTEVEWAEVPEVRMLREYVRVDTTPATGSELAGARFLAERLEAAGLETHIERLGERGANLWTILEGRRREALVLHNHIDVFPAEDAEQWKHPPFAGVIDPPHLYGRGVFDMKSVSVAQLQALLTLAASGTQPERSVIFLATGSEEVGSELGTRWVLARHPELVSRFWAVLTEGGIVEPVTSEEIKYWGVEFAHKRIAEAWVCSDRREPLEMLHEYLEEHRGSADALLTPEVATFAAQYAPSRQNRGYRRRLADLAATVDHPSRVAELPPYLAAMLHNEVVALPVQDDPGGGYRMKLVLRLLPGVELDSALPELLPDWATHGLTVTVLPARGTAHGSPLDHPAYTGLVEAIEEVYPDATVGPYFLPWNATDSRFFREAGIPSYGFSPFLIFTTDTFRVDATNERIGLPGFVDGVALYVEAVERLVRAAPH